MLNTLHQRISDLICTSPPDKHLKARMSPGKFLELYWFSVLLGMKAYLLYVYRSVLTVRDLFCLVSFFLPELLIIFVWRLMVWCLSPGCERRRWICATFKYVVLMICLLCAIAVYSLALASIYKVGFVLSWSTSLCALVSWKTVSGIALPEIMPVIFISSAFILTMLVGVAVTCYRYTHCTTRNEYEVLPNSESTTPATAPPDQSRSQIQPKRKLSSLNLVMLLIAYIFLSIVLRSDHSSDPDIAYNPMIQLVSDYIDFLGHRCRRPKTSLSGIKGTKMYTWISHCRSLAQMVRQYRSPTRQICFPRKEDAIETAGLDYLPRNKGSPIRNVVVIFLESTRTEMMPFNYESRFAKQHLTEEALGFQEITPFMAELAKKSRYSTTAHSPTSYTSKSILGGMCSMYPYPRNYGVEALKTFYHYCLPQLVRMYGKGTIESGYVQPHIIRFDDYKTELQRMGFETIYGAESFDDHTLNVELDYEKLRQEVPAKRGKHTAVVTSNNLSTLGLNNTNNTTETANTTTLGCDVPLDFENVNLTEVKAALEEQHAHSKEYVNMMGYEDEMMRGPMMEWVDSKVARDKAFFLVYSTSITHVHFDTPDYWPTIEYTKKHYMVNKYLNALSYVDNFLRKLMDDFTQRGLDKNTLFLFIGDHGVGLGENNAWYTTDVPYEPLFCVPFMLYTANEAWNRQYPPEKVTDGNWTTLDVLPTVLDAYRFGSEGPGQIVEEEEEYEGKSVLGDRKTIKDLPGLSVVNPGMSAIVLRENGRKVVLPGIGWRKEDIYDLAKDPAEEHPLAYALLDIEFKSWVREMRLVRSLYIVKVAHWYREGQAGDQKEEY